MSIDPSWRTVSVPVTTLWSDPDAVRAVDASMVASPPRPDEWPPRMSHEDKLDLGRCLTQLLYGEPVQVLQERAGWAHVVAPWQPSSRDARGYPGWVPSTHLTSPPVEGDRVAVVLADVAELTTEEGRLELSYATALPVVETAMPADTVGVCLPGGGMGRLPNDAVTVRAPSHNLDPGAGPLLEQGRRFIGLPYLWGGMSTYGLDCSGFVHIAFRVLGRVVPRDAHDQAAELPAVGPTEATTGDLLFFARPNTPVHHVGFATEVADVLLHAPGTGTPIEEAPMNQDRRTTLVAAARVCIGA